MAAPNLIQLSQDLAYKLQDPVSSGTSNGQRWTADGRLGYLRRAYRRLLRTILMLFPSLANQVFKNFTNITTLTTSVSGTFSFANYDEVFEVFCKLPDDEEYNRATYITPDEYISTYTGYSDFYNPDYNSKTFYWSVIADEVKVLPAMQYSVFFSYRKDLSQTMTYAGDVDIDVPGEYWDIILSLAAQEAYMDIGDVNMIEIYKKDVDLQINFIGTTKQMKENSDE